LRAALGSFAKMYSDRYADKNIRMNNVLPGYVATRWPEQEAIRERIPMKRYGQPRRSPRRWRSWLRTVPDTSPARTFVSTVDGRGHSDLARGV
jgi:NAD(P)-dependent dehydrogenase (short-subunit alcohol dehydrogenase family)